MYFKIEYNEFRKIAKFVGRVSGTGSDLRSTAVVLSTVPEGIHMASLTPDIWAEGVVDADVEIHGQVTLSGEWLAKILSALPLGAKDALEVAEADEELDIQATSGRYHRQVPLAVIDDPPLHEPLITKAGVKILPDTCDWIRTAKFAASTDSARGALNGVHLHPGGIVSTDSYRFVLIDFDWPAMIPTTIGLDLIKLFPDPDSYGDGDLFINTNEHSVGFEFGGLHLIGAKIAAPYPDINMIRGILPDENTPHQFEVQVTELKQIISALAPFAANTRGATIHPDGFVRLVTQDSGMAEDRIETGAVNLPGPVTVDLGFLKDVVRLLRDEETCNIRFHQDAYDKKPFIIQKDHVTVGAMPMRLA